MGKTTNKIGILFPLAATLLLVFMFVDLLRSVDSRNASVIENIKSSKAFVLDSTCTDSLLSSVIFVNGYAANQKDADFIASFLIDKQKEKGRLPSLYTLQKRDFGQVSVSRADSCGVFAARVKESCDNLGQNGDVVPFCSDSIGDGSGRISVYVFERREPSSLLKKCFGIKEEVPCEGVPVRLTAHFRDSVCGASSPVLGYVSTDSDGMAVFDGLDVGSSYSVLPVRSGFEYGGSRGTVNGKWTRRQAARGLSFSFEEKEHRIAVFSNSALKQIKADRFIFVRSPQEYRATVVRNFVFVLLAWWLMLAYLIIRNRKFNGSLIASAMFLTGMCVLMMFSMQDPLNDELHGVTMTQGVVAGVVLCIFLQGVDFVRFYRNGSTFGFDMPVNAFKWLFKPFRQKVKGLAGILNDNNAGIPKKILATLLVVLVLPFLVLDLLQITRLGGRVDRWCERLPKGAGWLGLALLLTALLWTPFGQAVGGMKVNLRFAGIVFQPSEIAKYLIILFIAAFFTQKADVIIAYSQPDRINKLGSKISALLWIILGLAVLMAMYIALGDMGPGLVIAITFILIYSLVKSKVNLDNVEEKDQWKRILSCDFATLIYGVLSFVLFLVIGHLLGNMLLFGILWFFFWVAIGYFGFRKRLFESPLLMNAIVFIFIFGGQIMGWIPALRDSSTVERFEARTKMCVNTWGDLDIEHSGMNAEPVSNTQVANGLWALSTGGFSGQGWGEGKPSLIPAFHTDMILSSIGEQRGWLGLLMVVLAFAILLRQMVVTGYRVGHPFAFYLCMGFAIVIGVQFFIIALGSSGMIPLTGVTVPFLSFGRVSMILNLAVFGIVLSLCSNIPDEETAVEAKVRQKAVNQYSYPVALVSVVYLFFAVSTLLVWQYYQVWQRDSTLIHPAYTIASHGEPLVDYNPRISLLVDNLDSGRIYDRNGLLLATSDKSEIDKKTYTVIGINEDSIDEMMKRRQKRYYPMAEHTFFMVGDRNQDLLFSYNDTHPAGYLAEAQHLSYLRGFDNILYDASGNPVKVALKTDRLRESAYLAPKDTVTEPIQLRDYSALIDYLKDGIDGKKVAEHNEMVKHEHYDLHLTLDARLQYDLQTRITNYMMDQYKKKGKRYFNLMRVSAVVLDAKNGDLLASANYPIPDYERLKAEKDNNYYSDNFKTKDWQSYTDIDLGTSYQTMPGSTAKVMSAMAGLMQCGASASEQTYYITDEDAVERNIKGEVIEPTGNVTMHDAIVKSSNCYFMNLVNDKDLYPSLDSVYKTTGVSIGGKVPYYFRPRPDGEWVAGFNAKVAENRSVAIARYANYRESVRKGVHRKMDAGEWKWAWGQGWAGHELQASPLNMARVASAVVNDGIMPVTQYVIPAGESERHLRNDGGVTLLTPDEARILKGYMLAEAANQLNRNSVRLPSYVGGKTGTPERDRVVGERVSYDKRTKKNQICLQVEKNINDGWYMFFVEGDATHHPIAVALRIERGVGSGAAVRLVGNSILSCLSDHHYIRK